MNVLYIADHSEQGGASKCMEEIVITLKNMNSIVNPIVLTCRNSKLKLRYDDNDVTNYVTHHRAVGFSYSRGFLSMIKYIGRFFRYSIMELRAKRIIKRIDLSNIDLIHINSTRTSIGYYIAKKIKKPVIVHLREFGSKGFDYNTLYYKKNFVDFMDRNTTRYIAVSKAVKDFWVKKGLNKDKIDVIYDSVKNDIKPKTSNSNRLSIVIVGYLMESKGQHKLLNSLLKLDSEILSNISVDIIGNGDKKYKRKLLKIIKENKLNDKVNLVGYVRNIPEKLGAYDIGIMASRSEAFGRTTIEYMHARLAVIASNTGSNLELINDGVNGLLFNYLDDNSLAEKISYLYHNRSHLDQLAISGYENAQNKFSTNVNIENLIEVYNKVK